MDYISILYNKLKYFFKRINIFCYNNKIIDRFDLINYVAAPES